MKIVIDARMMDGSSGIGRYIKNLLEQLQKLDQNNTYIVLLQSSNFEAWEPKAKNFSKQLANFRHFSFSEQLGFCRYLYKLNADLVHFPNINYPVMYARKKVITIHDLTLIDYKNVQGNALKHTIKYWAFRFVVKRAVRGASKIITPTKYVRKQLVSRYHAPAQKIHITYEAVDPLATSSKPIAKLANKDYLLYVGSAYLYKNLQRLVEAFENLIEKKPKLLLVLAGKEDYFWKQLAVYIDTNKLRNVVITGFVNDEQLTWLYRHARGYVFPSLSEGFGLPGLEAMQYSLPVAASNASCLPEVYGDAAIFFDPNNTEDITKQLHKLVSDNTLREQMVKNGRKLLALYSWKKTAEQTLKVYQDA